MRHLPNVLQRRSADVPSYVQIPLGGPDKTLSETRVYDLVSNKVQSGLRQSATLSDHRLFFNLDMYGFCPWVWSGHKVCGSM